MIAAALLVISSALSTDAVAGDCFYRCYYTPRGRRVCHTVCRGPHADVAVLSSTSALLLSTSALNNAHHKQMYLMQATEDAAHYLDSGKLTGVLPTLLQLSRKEAERTHGAEAAALLTEAELVDALLQSAEELLQN